MKFLILFLVGLGIVIAFPQDAFAAGFCRDVVGWQKSNVVCDIEYSDSGGGGLQKCLYRVESYGGTTYKYPSSGEYYGGEYWAMSPGTCTGSYVRLTPTLYVGNLLDCRDNGAGKCKLFAKAIDSPNNEQSQKDIVLLDIDYSAPTVSANNASSQWFTSREVTLSVSDGQGSGLPTNPGRYSWDANNFDAVCTTGGNGSYKNDDKIPVSQGSHRLYLCARDNAGNVGNWDSGPDQYRVDPIAPEVKSFSINGVSCSSNGPVFCPATVIVSSSVDITWSASDSGGSGINVTKYEIWRTQDPNNWGTIPHASGVTSPFSESPTPGTYWYGVHASDNANNCITEAGDHCGGVSSDSLDDRTARGPMKVIFGDQTAPTVSADNASSQWFQSRTTTLSASDSGGSGLAEARYNWDSNAMNSSCTSGGTTFTDGTVLPVAQGSHSLYLCARDNASNISSQSFSPYKVDSIAPIVGSFSVSPSGWTNGNITVSWTASDNDSGIQEVEVYSAPDNNGSPGTWVNIKDNASSPFPDSPSDGKWWYGIHVTDGAGNCVVESGQNCTPPPSGNPKKAQVDRTPPASFSLTSPEHQGTVNTENPSYSWIASSDSGSGLAPYRIQVDNNQNFNNMEDDRSVSGTNYTSVPSLVHAGYYWHVIANDNAGNSIASGDRFFNIQLNEPPNASFNCSPANCTVYDTETLTFNNNSSDPDNNISQSQWDILNWGSAPDNTCGGTCNHTLQPISPNTYTMQLKVIDSAGASDTDTRSFTVKRDIVAGFMCSLDNVNFVACSSLSGQVSQGEVLYLKDSSALSEYTVVSEGASSVTSRTWKINGSTFSSGNNANPSTTIPSQGTVTLDLDARDNQGRSDTQTHTLNPQVPFPEFQEISPF